MKKTKNSEHVDRRNAAADAKANLLQAFRAANDVNDPARAAKQAERIAIAEAREVRRAERKQAKIEEQNRIEREKAEREAAAAAAAKAEAEAREAEEKKLISRVLEDEAARKAERDRRYANRKARNSR
ncbi:MAG: DUF6481 family protein [Roseibium sp.]